jgi:hypothetical protein
MVVGALRAVQGRARRGVADAVKSASGVSPSQFAIGSRVRYKPGKRTQGYEHLVEADGRVPVIVVGHSRSGVRVQVDVQGWSFKMTVSPESLTDPGAEAPTR